MEGMVGPNWGIMVGPTKRERWGPLGAKGRGPHGT